jgi:uncharacterized OsmC-like protein
VTQAEGYRFVVSFPEKDYEPIVGDEPAPLSHDAGPNPVRLLGAAIGNCLAASLTFCMSKRGVKIEHGIVGHVVLTLVRNENKRLRVGAVRVTIEAPEGAPADVLEACRTTFEDFCTVTASVREGIDVSVELR